MFMGANGPLYAFSLFLPSIINQLGVFAQKQTKNLLEYLKISRLYRDSGQPAYGPGLCRGMYLYLCGWFHGRPTR